MKWLLGIAVAAVLALVVDASAQTRHVAIVKSKDIAAYRAPIMTLKDALSGLKLSEHVAGANGLGDVGKPDLVVALGSRAYYHAGRAFPGTPVLFAMVLNPAKYPPKEAAMVAGVALHVPPEILLTQLKMVAPSVKRVGVVHHATTSAAVVAQATARAGVLGLTIVPIAVAGASEVKAALETHAGKVDALWMPPDPQAVSKSSYAAAVAFTRDQKLPLLAYSGKFVQAGALLSVSPSYRSIGSQLGLMTRRILEDGTSPASLGVASPIGTELVINLDVARAIGLTVDADVLESADEVFGD